VAAEAVVRCGDAQAITAIEYEELALSWRDQSYVRDLHGFVSLVAGEEKKKKKRIGEHQSDQRDQRGEAGGNQSGCVAAPARDKLESGTYDPHRQPGRRRWICHAPTTAHWVDACALMVRLLKDGERSCARRRFIWSKQAGGPRSAVPRHPIQTGQAQKKKVVPGN